MCFNLFRKCFQASCLRPLFGISCFLLVLKACLKKSAKLKEADSKECPGGTSAGTKISTEDQDKRTATSLILFEEVDIIFDDDAGFLAAIKHFMTTTKRPVILTTSGE